jgi:hypothetical protein
MKAKLAPVLKTHKRFNRRAGRELEARGTAAALVYDRAPLEAGPAIRVLHVVTVHFSSPRWIEIQLRHLREHLGVPFQTWTSLERIDPSYGERFDHVFEQRGSHAGKLNHLAMEVCAQAGDEDLLMFLDGDAFPIADPMPLIADGLSRAPLVAVRREENLGEPQPHPCFCVTTARAWRSLPGDWSSGPTWPGPQGRVRTDVGAMLLRTLELRATPWVEVLRSNTHDLDPVYFGVYGGVVYHHGAGFRAGGPSPQHNLDGPGAIRAPSVPGVRALAHMAAARRRRRWVKQVQRSRIEVSERVYEQIAAGGEQWLAELTGGGRG